jgi:hypothetical protein
VTQLLHEGEYASSTTGSASTDGPDRALTSTVASSEPSRARSASALGQQWRRRPTGSAQRPHAVQCSRSSWSTHRERGSPCTTRSRGVEHRALLPDTGPSRTASGYEAGRIAPDRAAAAASHFRTAQQRDRRSRPSAKVPRGPRKDRSDGRDVNEPHCCSGAPRHPK